MIERYQNKVLDEIFGENKYAFIQNRGSGYCHFCILKGGGQIYYSWEPICGKSPSYVCEMGTFLLYLDKWFTNSCPHCYEKLFAYATALRGLS